MNAWPNQGIHHGIPFVEYRACDLTNADTHITSHGKSVSKSLIVDFIEDPAAWRKSPPKKTTSAMRAGSLFDCLLTEPEQFNSRYAISEYADFRGKDAKEWKAAIEAAGVAVIKDSDLEAARGQVAAVMAKPEAAKLINGSQNQVAFRHKTIYPFWSKGLIDILPDDDETIVDIKTCEPGALQSKRTLAAHIYKWKYHIQAGAYCEGFTFAGGDERIRFKFIFVSSAPPYTVAVVELPFAAISLGGDIYRAGAKKLAECLETNKWPSVWDGEVEVDLPEYAYTEKGE